MRRVRVSRRCFIGTAGSVGAGLMISALVPTQSFAKQLLSQTGTAPVALAPRTPPTDVDAYLHLGADGKVTVFTGKVEFGQGIQTAFAQLVAEELDVSFDRVDMVMGITNQTPYDIGTFGSLSIRTTGVTLRQAAAEMRQWLLELGATRFGTATDGLATRDGTVYVASQPSASVGYGDLAAGQKVDRSVKGTARLKDPSTYTIVGQSIPRVDVPFKVNGSMKYGYDTTVPGMVHGKIIRPPSWGATLQSIDFSAAQNMPGVVGVFRDGDFAGLAAERHEQAENATAAVQATWKETGSPYTSENIFDALKSTRDDGQMLKQTGNVAAGLASAVRTIQVRVTAPYIAHAALEPVSGLASVQSDKVELWTSTQDPFDAQDAVAQALNLPREIVIVYPRMSGGAFGRKVLTDAEVEAARLSKALGRPVRVNWNRAEEFQFDHLRPAMLVELTAGLDDLGHIVGWDWATHAAAYYPEGTSQATTTGAQWGANVLDMYDLPNAQSVFYQSVSPLPPWFWRDNGAPVNALARETAIDELAELAGTDPVSFRERLVGNNPRLAAVMHAAIEQAGWTPGVGSTGQGIGIALDVSDGTYLAEVARVNVDANTGTVQLQHVGAAIDCGLVVNPDAARCQIEGSIVMQGTSSTLKEEIRFAGGKVLNSSFAEYGPARSLEVPSVGVVFVEDRTLAPGGIGEPAVGGVSAAVSNAIYDAVGVRVRDLPFRPDRVLAALQTKA